MIGFVNVERTMTHADVRPSTVAPSTASATGAKSSSCSSTTGADYAASPSMYTAIGMPKLLPFT